MFKKVISVFTLFVFIIHCFIVFAGEPSNIEAACDLTNDTVLIYGSVPSGGKRTVCITVLKPDAKKENLSDLTAMDLINQIVTITSNEDGSFQFEYTMPQDADMGMYTVYVTSPESGSLKELTFDYCSPEILTNAVNSATLEQMKEILVTYSKYIGIDTGTNSLFAKLNNLTSVLIAMEKTDFTDTVHIKNEFRLQVLMAACKEISTDTIDLIMPEICSLVTSDLTEVYNRFNDGLKGLVKNTMLSTKDYTDLTSIKEKFEEGVILAGIKEAGYPKNKEMITLYKDKIGINFNAYNSLGLTKQAEIFKDIANHTFVTYKELKKFFEDAVESAEKGTPSSGGGGGGRRVSAGNTSIELVQAPPVNEFQFNDLDGYEWAKDSIINLQKAGVIVGDGNGNFMPERIVTREEFVKMLVMALNLPLDGKAANFNDVDSGAWYAPYISAAVNAGLITGYPNGDFGVHEPITRQDVSVIIYRAMNKYSIPLVSVNEKIEFADSHDIDSYATEAVSMLQVAGIMNGVGGWRFAPKEYTTRAMAAKVIYSIYKLQ